MATVEATVEENQNLEPETRPATFDGAQELTRREIGGFVLGGEDTGEHGVPTHLVHGEARIDRSKVKYTLEVPDEITDHVPLILIPGYGGIKPAYRQLRHHIAASGKPAVTLRSARNQGILSALRPSNLLHPELLPSKGVWAVMRDIRKHQAAELGKTVEQFDLSGHSMGGFIAALVAKAKPEYVRSLLLVASTGLDEAGLWDYAQRVPGFARHELGPVLINGELRFDTESNLALHALNYALRNFLRTAAEGLAVAYSNIRPLLGEFRACGIKTAILGFGADKLVPLNESEDMSRHLVDYFEQFPIETAGHIAPQKFPAEVAAFQLWVLQQLHTSTELKPAA